MTEFFQLLFSGVALGAVYSLIALGFTVIYRASRVINFSQGAFILVSAYVISWLATDKGVPFFLAVLLSIAFAVAVGVAFQMLVLRHLVGRSAFVAVMVTIGASIAMTAAVSAIFGPDQKLLGDPWGSSAVHAAGITFTWVKLWSIIVVAVVLYALYVFDQRSRYGLAMRATASDHIAALAAGVPVGRVHAIAWGMAATLGTIAGMFLAGFPNSPNLGLGDASFRAFPAIILGGLESPKGAVVGGVSIGVVEVLTSGYSPGWAGTNFSAVAPYIVMIAVLLAKPYGLFGSVPAERI